MSSDGHSFSINEIVDSAKQKLSEHIGDQLVALIHFGNHLDASLSPNREDRIQLLIVLREIDAQALDQLADCYKSISGIERTAPMVMTRSELEASTDVFPTTFLEMKHHHQLLLGDDVLADLKIESTYLRIRCEQELKNLLLRLQAKYLSSHDDLNSLKRLFHQSIKSLLRTLHAVQVLFDRPFVQPRADLITEISETLGIDGEQLAQLARMDEQPLDDSLDLVHSALINLVEIVAASATSVDQIPNQVELVEEHEA